MTTALQFSVYDMCHCYNNLNSTHTLNMIVYFCPFGLQFELLQQSKCAGLHASRTWNHTSRWVVVYRSFSWRRSFDTHSHIPNWQNHYIKPYAVQCMGRSWHWWLWLLRVRERSHLRWARRIQLEAGLQPRQPFHVPRAQLSNHPTNHRSYHRRWLPCYATSMHSPGELCLHIIPWVSWITISRDSSTQLVAR